jgi:hypothetical protein
MEIGYSFLAMTTHRAMRTVAIHDTEQEIVREMARSCVGRFWDTTRAEPKPCPCRDEADIAVRNYSVRSVQSDAEAN